jgi:hypothetical protein
MKPEDERDEKDARLPYEPPRVSWEDVLDARPGLTAACNKQSTLDPGCDTSSISS